MVCVEHGAVAPLDLGLVAVLSATQDSSVVAAACQFEGVPVLAAMHLLGRNRYSPVGRERSPVCLQSHHARPARAHRLLATPECPLVPIGRLTDALRHQSHSVHY